MRCRAQRSAQQPDIHTSRRPPLGTRSRRPGQAATASATPGFPSPSRAGESSAAAWPAPASFGLAPTASRRRACRLVARPMAAGRGPGRFRGPGGGHLRVLGAVDAWRWTSYCRLQGRRGLCSSVSQAGQVSAELCFQSALNSVPQYSTQFAAESSCLAELRVSPKGNWWPLVFNTWRKPLRQPYEKLELTKESTGRSEPVPARLRTHNTKPADLHLGRLPPGLGGTFFRVQEVDAWVSISIIAMSIYIIGVRLVVMW